MTFPGEKSAELKYAVVPDNDKLSTWYRFVNPEAIVTVATVEAKAGELINSAKSGIVKRIFFICYFLNAPTKTSTTSNARTTPKIIKSGSFKNVANILETNWRSESPNPAGSVIVELAVMLFYKDSILPPLRKGGRKTIRFFCVQRPG